MLKTYLLITTLITFQTLFSQVGIGTTNPTEMLDIKGDLLITDKIKINSLPSISPNDEGFKLLVRQNNSNIVGLIKKLTPNDLDVVPMRMQNYKITNIKRDDVKNIDLQLDANKYIVSISNFKWIGKGLQKKANFKKSSGLFEYRVFQENNTWHLVIRNKYLDTKPSDKIEYEISLIIYQKRFFKHLPKITETMNGNQTATATASPL